MSDSQNWTASTIIDDLLGQYSAERAPRFRRLMRGLLNLVDTQLYTPMRGMFSSRTIDSAQGVWLDRIGERLAYPRPVIRAFGPRLGFKDGETSTPFDTAPFESTEEVFAGRTPIIDATYRTLLRMRAAGLQSGNTIREIRAIGRMALPNSAWEYSSPMNIRVTDPIAATSEQDALYELARDTGVWPKPAGVSMSRRYTAKYRIYNQTVLDVLTSTDVAAITNTQGFSGKWFNVPFGRTQHASADTGPGTNTIRGYAYTDFSNQNGLTTSQIADRGTVVFLRSVIPEGTARTITLRTCITGRWNLETDSQGVVPQGLAVEGKTESGSWTQITLLRGYAYSNTYTVGDTITDYGGATLTCVQDGGWVDTSVSIPDDYVDLRLRPVYGSSNLAWDRDICLWSLDFFGDDVIL